MSKTLTIGLGIIGVSFLLAWIKSARILMAIGLTIGGVLLAYEAGRVLIAKPDKGLEVIPT